MTEIYDFTKFKSEKEIEIHEEEQKEKKASCFGCPDCDGIAFVIYTDYRVACAECGKHVGKKPK